MSHRDTLAGVRARTVTTDRLETHLLESGEPTDEPVVFLHGNVSSARFFEPQLSRLPPDRYGLAPNLRGYGDSDPRPVDATAGLTPFVADLETLVGTLPVEPPITLVGWSLGGGVAMQYAIEHPEQVETLVLVNPVSPYGFGGTKDREGTPCFDDYAGSGGGITNDAFVARLADDDRSDRGPAAPRTILRTYYVAPAHSFDPEREEAYLTAMLETTTGDQHYPGSATTSDNWPGIAPGETGVNNALSPKYCDCSALTAVDPDVKPAVLWLRGGADQLISNESLFDVGTLGQMGQLTDWPGEDVFPPQPMVDQTRAVLETYADRGGSFEEGVFRKTGHTPHVEVPGDFADRLASVLT